MMTMVEICFKDDEVPAKDIYNLVKANPGAMMPEFGERETPQEGKFSVISCVFTNPGMLDLLKDEIEGRYAGKVSFR